MRDTTGTFKKQRFLPLELLRGVAALLVATGHLESFNGRQTIDYTMCVAFFFILSGFVLSHAYGDAIFSGTIKLRDYAILRFARLYPLHILTAFVMALLLIHGNAPRAITASGALETVSLTQSIFSGGWSFNAPSWSIGAEFWAGLVILPLCSRSVYLRTSALFVAAVAFVAVDLDGGFMAGFAERYGTALGCITIGWFLHRLPALDKPVLGWAITFTSFALMMFPPMTVLGRPALEFCYIVTFSTVVAFLAHSILPSSLRAVAVFVGNVSYGIYLWHWPLLIWLHPTTPFEIFRFFLFLIPLASISYFVFERPCREAIRTKLGRTSAPSGMSKQIAAA